MLEVCYFLAAKQLRTLNFFVDSMGLTMWTFCCLNWVAFASQRNIDARYYLSHQLFQKNADNECSYNRWKCISHFLLTHLPIFGAFSAIFKWDNTEMIFRIGGTFPDLFAKTRRDVGKAFQEKLCNNFSLLLPIPTPTDSGMSFYKTHAEVDKLGTFTPSPHRKKNTPRVDMGVDVPQFDLGAYETEDEDEIEDDAVPPSSILFVKSKSRAAAGANKPLFLTPSGSEGLSTTPTTSSSDTTTIVASPPSDDDRKMPAKEKIVDEASRGGITALLAAAEEEKWTSHDEAKSDRQTTPVPVGKEDKEDVHFMPDAVDSFLKKAPASPLIDSPCEDLSKDGSSENPIIFEDTPPASPEHWMIRRARNFKPLGKKRKSMSKNTQTNANANKKKRTKKPCAKPASAALAFSQLPMVFRKAAPKTPPVDCGLELTQNNSYICD